MAYDFPASPTSGQTYTPSGGPTYTWDGVVWKTALTGASVVVYAGDTAPSSPVTGTLWWDSTRGDLFIYYNDGNTSQWVVANAGGGAGGVDDVIGGIITIASTAPSAPVVGDVWIDTT